MDAKTIRRKITGNRLFPWPQCSLTDYLLMLVTTRGKLIFILEKSNSHQTNDQRAAAVVVGLTTSHYVSPGLKQQKVYGYNNVLLAKIV